MKRFFTFPFLSLLASPFVFAAHFDSQAASAATGQNWPQWRGPAQTGAAPDANPPTTWSETNHVKWKVKIPGDGTATPIIWENFVFVQTAIATGKKGAVPATDKPEKISASRPQLADGPGSSGRRPGDPSGGRGGRGNRTAMPTEVYQFALLCLDRVTGKMLWRQIAKEEVPHEGFLEGNGSFAPSSGLTDGSHVYACFGSRGLYCYDLRGNLAWKQDFGKMRIKMGFGEGASPALFKDTLVLNWDNEDGSFITALDKKTGETLWKESRDEQTTWATPLIVEHGGTAQVITSGTRKIRGYDLATGKLIWECKGLTANVIPSPVADSEKVYCTSGFMGSALLAIKLDDAKGDISGSSAIVWNHKKSTPYVPSPLLYEGKVYFYGVNDPRWSCLEASSGKVLIDAEKIEGLSMVYASPIAAAGRIYLTDRKGVTVVLKASDKLEPLAANKLDDEFDASPAAVGQDLFLRGRKSLYCLTEK